MLSSFNISTRLSILNILIVIVAIFFVCMLFLGFNNIESHSTETLHREMLEVVKQKLEVSTNTTAQMLGEVCKDVSSKEEQLEIIRDLIQNVRYESDESGYFFVYEGTIAKVLPIKTELEEQDLADLSDSNGVFFIKEFTKAAQKGGGFVEYLFDKPNNGIQPKLSYIINIEGTPYYLGTGIYIDNLITAQLELHEDLQEVKNTYLFWTLAGIIIFLVFVAFPTSRAVQKSISQPITKISEVLQLLGTGKKADIIKNERKDEIGLITDSLNKVIEGQNNASDFASAIGNENFDHKYQALSDEDILGNSLLSMRESLKAHRKSEKDRHWKVEGLSRFNNIIRSHSENLQEVAVDVLKELVIYIGANQGCIYQVQQDNDDEVLKRLSTYAWGRTKFVKEELKKGIGIVGQAWIEKEPIYLEEVPEEYPSITSGLGDANPKMVFVLPLTNDKGVQGLLEIASFKRLGETERGFLESLAENLASWLWSVRNSEETKALLERSQKLTAHLRAGEEEVRQNMEELQATHEEMRRRERLYKKQIEEMKTEKMN